MGHDHVAVANESYRAAFEGLTAHVSAGETRQFGSISAVSTGLPFPEYNRLFAFEPPELDQLGAALSWLRATDCPYWVTVTPSVIAALDVFPAAFDLVKSHEDPGMVLPSLTEIPSRQSVAEIASVTDESLLSEFVSVYGSVFDRPAEQTAQVYRSLLTDDASSMFVGRLDGQAVACGLLSRHETVAGVYAVGVRESFRRQGLGKLMTCDLLRAGREAGCEIGVLQSTEMALPLYEQLGFEQVTTYHHFEPRG